MISNGDVALRVALEAYLAGHTVVFDLDDTLYPEACFLQQAYNAFAQEIALEYGTDAQQLADFMLDRLRNGGRSTLLQELCSRFALPSDPCRERLMFCLRERPLTQSLRLFAWAADFFRSVPDLQRCAIITNGHIRQQQNKLAHLPQLHKFPQSQIVFANAHAPKPAPDAARYLERIMPCNDPLYFGDAQSDAAFARAAAWSFFKLDFRWH